MGPNCVLLQADEYVKSNRKILLDQHQSNTDVILTLYIRGRQPIARQPDKALLITASGTQIKS